MSKVFLFFRRGISESLGVKFSWSAIVLRLLLAALLWCAAGDQARADIEAPRAPRVPVAKPGQAVAVRGFPLDIKLLGLTSTTRQMEFIIRQAPKQGKLAGPPVQVDKESATVKYTGNPDSKAVTDTITFAVKVEGSGTSEEATVNIKLVDPAPVLEMQAGLDLGRVLANEVEERTIPIYNKGNAPFRATLPLPAGWSWLQPTGGNFDLAPGERMEAVLRVRTRSDGEIDHKIVFFPGTILRVIGRALPPFLGYPSLVRLQWESGTARRAWHFNIRNNQGEPMTVRLSAPTGIAVPESVTIAPTESVQVNVASSGQLNQNLSGKIRLDGVDWSQDVAFEAPAAPALVEIQGVAADGTVDFGILEKAVGSAATKVLTLKNIGGTPAAVRWDAPRFFVIDGLPVEFVLAPQSEKQFRLSPKPDEPGRLKEDWTLHLTGGDRVLPLLADIDPEAARAQLMSGKVLKNATAVQGQPEEPGKPTTEKGHQLKVQILSRGLMEAIPKKDPSLPLISNVRLLVEEPERLVFEWDAPAPGTWTYRVLVRMLRNHGPPQGPIPEYDAMDNVKVTNTPTGGRAEVTKLRGGARWTCAIYATRPDGVSTGATPDLNFITPFEEPSRWPWRLGGLFGIVALVLYVRQKWREEVKW
ncbi:MAG: fibronectin type protein [Verrucomicrobiales bacterium]|nr:fibronectin type protein [Verrucomicrobiales bacterium]